MANNFSEPEPKPAAKSQPEPAKDNRPIIYLPRLQLAEVVFDASIFITYHNHDQLIRQHLGNPQIFHTEVTETEWRKQFKWHKSSKRLAEEKTARGLDVFDSTYLPETQLVNAIANEIERCLRRGGIKKMESRGLTDNDKRDIKTVAYGIAHGIDVVTRDKLFFTIEKMFKKDITIYVDRERNSIRQALWLVTRLEEKGVQTMPNLAHLIQLNSSEVIEAEIEEARLGDETRRGGESK